MFTHDKDDMCKFNIYLRPSIPLKIVSFSNIKKWVFFVKAMNLIIKFNYFSTQHTIHSVVVTSYISKLGAYVILII